MNDNRNIYLLGFMGTGKTKIGRILAQRLSWPFLDTDEQIQQEAGLSIPEIFKLKGEKGFRQLEKACIIEISQRKRTVISLGGGAVIDPENWELISKSGITITLSYPPEIIFSRINKKTDRPLLDENRYGEKYERIKILLKTRESFYQRADLILHMNSEVSAKHIAEAILGFLRGMP